jgi:transcriptional antiterminator RfaH
MADHWYALNVKPHKEHTVAEWLDARDEMEVFFPARRVKPVNPRAAKIRPYFPGYLFVRLDLDEEGQNALRWTPGTNGLVRFGDVPAIVPDNLINELRKRLIELNKVGGQEAPQFSSGDRVRITSGPFSGYSAIFDENLQDQQRVQVLLEFLGNQSHRMQLDREVIEKI